MFRDRRHAGALLGERVRSLALSDPVVLGLPRGGVVVAAEVARALGAPLDVLVVRKLGAPGNPELGIGAIAEDGITVLNDALIARLRVSPAEIEAVAEREQRELVRRTAAYRRGGQPLSLAGRSVVVVDDGLATGFTARAAVAAARARGAAMVVLAVPVAAPETVAEFSSLVDEVVCVEVPEFLFAVGAAYADFSQTGDDEVERLLAAAAPAGTAEEREVMVDGGGLGLPGTLSVPAGAAGVVVFAHGSGSSRHSPRNRAVASSLQETGLATLLFDLLTPGEDADRSAVFDIPLLGARLAAATRWLRGTEAVGGLPVGYFGASTGAAAALWAAAGGEEIRAVVSRGGRPDLAAPRLGQVRAPTLLIVGGADPVVLSLNREAQAAMTAECRLEVVPGATHLFEEPGALERVSRLARDWFLRWLPPAGV
ncbi:MAG: phosphoribosyl transferase [Actinobacteria bacterium RBG_16_70_17]|nr:MAG: phosphoribosyl transferase [Actinobacteria bacterium RBG_16_70_17]